MDFTGRGAGGAASGSEPIIRTVGFNVAGAEQDPEPAAANSAVVGGTAGSPSPVMIPPPLVATPRCSMYLETLSEDNPTPPELSLEEPSVMESITDAVQKHTLQVQAAPPPSEGDGTSKQALLRSSASTVGMNFVGSPSVDEMEGVPEAPAAAKADKGKGKEKGAGGPPAEIVAKPKLTREQRREIQERQRAEKAAKKAAEGGGGGGAAKAAKPAAAKPAADGDRPSLAPSAASAPGEPGKARRAGERETPGDVQVGQGAEVAPDAAGGRVAAAAAAKVTSVTAKVRKDLFAHLPQFEADAAHKHLVSKVMFGKNAGQTTVPVCAVELGIKYLNGEIKGGNARCVAMLRMLMQVIRDYKTPSQKSLGRDLTQNINQIIQFLIDCRPMSVSMGNAIRWLKLQIATVTHQAMSEADTKKALLEDVETYIHEKIVFADKVIMSHAVSKITDGDVVLTYASSEVVLESLLEAHRLKRNFRVVVVDSRPKNEGRQLLTRLLDAGLPCTFIHINALAYIMREVSKVFLGASSITANGTVISRVGTASVAMVAHEWGIPVMICCETCKFHEKVQLDSICHNELGNPSELAHVAGRPELAQDAEKGLHVVNLTYDAMPPEFITMIITEFGMIPPTSVPVIIREYRKEPAV